MIVGITGHQDIPLKAMSYIRKKIQDFVVKHPEMIAMTSLAKGADQLFADISINAGKKLHVIIPCENYVSTFQNKADLMEYAKLLKAASWVETLPNRLPNEKAFYLAGKKIVEMSDEIIAIWDGENAHGLGGTGDIVGFAKVLNKKITVVWPKNFKR